MKKIIVLALVVTMVFSFAACGNKSTTVTENEPVAETGAPNIETVAVGNKISTDFIEITVTESGFADSLRQSINKGGITYTFGPEASEETEYAYLKGTIMNKATSSISDGIFAEVKVGEYNLEEGDITIYKSNGDTVWGELSPLIEYNFIMYIEVPNALVSGNQDCDFNFAFDENLDNVIGKKFAERAYKYTSKIIAQKDNQ